MECVLFHNRIDRIVDIAEAEFSFSTKIENAHRTNGKTREEKKQKKHKQIGKTGKTSMLQHTAV